MREVNQGFPLPARAPKPCPICGEPAVFMIGGPCLCPDHLEEQRPLIGPWDEEIKALIRKHLEKGLYKGYIYRSLSFLSGSALEIEELVREKESA